uniref:Bromo domain-containing protein n=1 Tax=Vombatus ursinus TaxID=29139 RepID=A0A4X2KR50_VOMUR
VYLQMGHDWVWLDSEQDYPNDSELSNDYRSLFSSWDSSLDLEVGSWRETEEPGAEELEESNLGRESSDPLTGDGGSEEFQQETEQFKHQNLLHFLSEGGTKEEPKEEKGEGCVSEVESRPPLGECDDGLNIKEAPLHLGNDHVPSHRTDPNQGDPVKEQLLFKKTLLPVWKMIANHRFSSPFLKPVSDRQAPGYKDVVKRPMDLTSLKRNLSKGHIRSMAQFERDLMLMFQNAVMYNDSDHHIYHMAIEMQKEVLEQIQVLYFRDL